MLNPFFSYFGSKYRLAKYYPIPIHNIIIEPFAGSAGYSLKYPNKKILLYETYEPLVQVWDYLINVSESEIFSLPVGPYNKENPIDKESIPEEAKILIGFWLTESQTSTSRYPLSKSRGGNWSERKKTRIASQLKYIRHWEIKHQSFDAIPNIEATWFIDPPYQQAGKRYKNNKIDYNCLAKWSKERSGQVIVCEQSGADWLIFDREIPCRNASNVAYKEIFWEN